ncbi:MAG: inositol monophosphatase family protein [Zetaproteobacteria bacterium]|nr:inositol monophosphatase family protein [Zetaproteobacteria bacterium]
MLERELEFAVSLARQAGELVVSMRGRASTSYKSGVEMVTAADLASDQLIRSRIVEAFPQDEILSEEHPDKKEVYQQRVWIVDPIDGTVNYAYGHPYYAISIALYDAGRAQVGVVFNPSLDEMYTAVRGQGAFLNGERIQFQNEKELQRCVVGTGFPYSKHLRPKAKKWLSYVLDEVSDIRRNGAAALDICHVATGRLDCFYETVSLWDCAAARLVATESGATFGHIYPLGVSEQEEMVSENLLVASAKVFKQMRALLQQVPKDYREPAS